MFIKYSNRHIGPIYHLKEGHTDEDFIFLSQNTAFYIYFINNDKKTHVHAQWRNLTTKHNYKSFI